MNRVNLFIGFKHAIIGWIVTLSIAGQIPANGQLQTTVITRQSEWSYNDKGTNLGTAWREKSYDYSGWNKGKAPLGYGNDIINTELEYGSDASNKRITSYFRKEIIINNPDLYNSIELELLRDDGAAVYLNGNLLISSNLPEEINYISLASDAASPEEQTKYMSYTLSAEYLVSGSNIFAVEVHQDNVHSSDLIFDLSLTLSSSYPRTVVINEIMADNHSSYIEDDFNQFVDYIELLNVSASVIDLSGFHLSDNPDNPEKWKIPNNTRIDPGEFIVLYADGADTLMHTNFKLGLKGETLGLYDWYGRIIDTMDYPAQLTDIAYGRDQGKHGVNYYYASPSPGEVNPKGYLSKERALPPSFSIQGGLFNSPISIVITAGTSADIRYSRDGSIPLSTGSHYNGPIDIANTEIIKARAFEPGKLPSVVVTNSYFINEGIDLPVISISLDDEYLSDRGYQEAEFSGGTYYKVTKEGGEKSKQEKKSTQRK